MKRAKITLVAIATLGIVGGVLASKAKSSDTIFSTTVSGASATAAVTSMTLTDQGIGTVTNPNVFYTDVDGNAAFQTIVYSSSN